MMRTSAPLPFSVEAVLFDLDDTLYDRDKAYYQWATVFVEKYFSESTESQPMIDLLVKLDMHEDTPRDLLFSQFKHQYPFLDIPVTTLMEEYYYEFPRYIEAPQEVQETLHALTAADIPFGIITNGSARQLRKIEILGLGQLTSCIFVSHLFGKEKPDTAIFLAAADHLQKSPEKILFVGDNPYNDVWGAHRIGMRTAWLQRARPWPTDLPRFIADMTIHGLSDLLEDSSRQWKNEDTQNAYYSLER